MEPSIRPQLNGVDTSGPHQHPWVQGDDHWPMMGGDGRATMGGRWAALYVPIREFCDAVDEQQHQEQPSTRGTPLLGRQ